MTGQSGLERGYRRLLAWYPRGFHAEHGDEMLAVLLAGAADGQRRPGLLDTADVLKSALGMRLRPVRRLLLNPDWTGALAVYSFVAPLFVLAVTVLEVAIPYHRPAWPVPGGQPAIQIGGLSMLGTHFVDVAIGCQIVIAVLALLGLRLTALLAVAASVGYLVGAGRMMPWVPYPLQLITAGAYLLEVPALAVSPGPRHGRHLANWRYPAVMLVAAAAVQASTFVYGGTAQFFAGRADPHLRLYLAISAVLAAAVLVLALVLRLNRYFVLLLAAAVYPYVMQLLCGSLVGHTDLLANPLPGHLVLLFLPTVLAACVILISPAARRSGPVPPGPEQPPVAA